MAWRGLRVKLQHFTMGSILGVLPGQLDRRELPTPQWNECSLDGLCTNNNAEGWHTKIRKLAGKAHPNIYEVVEFFKAEQTATEVSLMQLAAGGLPVRRRRKYQRHEKNSCMTIKEKYEAGDYTLSELVKAYSNWVSF